MNLKINDLHYKNLEKDRVLHIKYNEILTTCANKIIFENSNNNDELIFYVPIFNNIIGYDIIDCLVYIIFELRKNGFNVRYINPNVLYINWTDPDKIKKKNQQLKLLYYEDLKTKNIMDNNESFKDAILIDSSKKKSTKLLKN
jgi:hypothetical protein